MLLSLVVAGFAVDQSAHQTMGEHVEGVLHDLRASAGVDRRLDGRDVLSLQCALWDQRDEIFPKGLQPPKLAHRARKHRCDLGAFLLLPQLVEQLRAQQVDRHLGVSRSVLTPSLLRRHPLGLARGLLRGQALLKRADERAIEHARPRLPCIAVGRPAVPADEVLLLVVIATCTLYSNSKDVALRQTRCSYSSVTVRHHLDSGNQTAKNVSYGFRQQLVFCPFGRGPGRARHHAGHHAPHVARWPHSGPLDATASDTPAAATIRL